MVAKWASKIGSGVFGVGAKLFLDSEHLIVFG
jgi:hypothetical protein